MPKSCTAADYMSAALVTFTPDMSVLDAINQMILHRISGAPVLSEDGVIIGMLSEYDCLQVALQSAYHSELGGRVSEYMATEVETIDASISILDLAQKFLYSSFRRYPVMRDNQLVGQISRHDMLRALEDLTKS